MAFSVHGKQKCVLDIVLRIRKYGLLWVLSVSLMRVITAILSMITLFWDLPLFITHITLSECGSRPSKTTYIY